MLPKAATARRGHFGQGFERYYGFLGGETSQWYPDLVEDNHFIEPPNSPENGYHLSKDLADQAIKMIRDQKASSPSKPWFMFTTRARTMLHTTPRRNTSTNIREN